MNKDELKQYIKNMKLEEAFETMLLTVVEKAPEVNQALLDTLADLIENQADFYQQSADLLDQEADEYEALSTELNTLDEEESAQKAEALLKNQQTLLKDIQQKKEEVLPSAAEERLSPPTTPPVHESLHQLSQAGGPLTLPSANTSEE
jgi:predicted nucleotide-binding protein (sugar kinase/HSP70/actin superfamily)